MREQTQSSKNHQVQLFFKKAKLKKKCYKCFLYKHQIWQWLLNIILLIKV